MSDDTRRRKTAQRGEDEAAAFLRAAGWTILDRNWHCRGGELDIVAQKDDTVAFVEVRTAAYHPERRPEDSVRGIKRHRVVKAAQAWLAQHPQRNVMLRFDVVGIEIGTDRSTTLRHYPAAFTADILY